MRLSAAAGRVFASTVIVTAGAVMAVRPPLTEIPHQPVLFAAMIALAAITAALKVTLPFAPTGSSMPVACAVDVASLLLLGPRETMVVAATSVLCRRHLKVTERSSPWTTLFDVGVVVLAVQGAGVVLSWTSDPGAVSFSALGRPLVAAAATYFLLTTGFGALAIAFSKGQPILTTWRTEFVPAAPGYFVGAGTAALAAMLLRRTDYWFAPLAFAPIFLTYRTYKVYLGRIEGEQRHVQQTSDLHLATIEALARAIDAKDQNTQMHIRRVQMYAAGMAKVVGLSPAAIQGVKTAALLHDIGKLAVPEHILSKPGPLTQEEFQKIRIHPEVGAEIIAAVPFPYPVAPIILSHHERWDGKGYPKGLSGEEIPIGARILTIVDYFDAVTTERPYHKALSHESAISLLKHEAGRALDPRLVDIFVAMLPALIAEANLEQSAAEAVVAPKVDGLGSTAAGLVPKAALPNAFENIAHAHREIYALYEIAQSMGTSLGVADTMALISSKLTKVIPWSGCALFLAQDEGDALKCRFAAGVDAPQLLNCTLKAGEGLSGWVARNRRTVVNGNPHSTFEVLGLQAPRLRSAIVVPLHNNDTFIGCLALYHVDANRYHEEHSRLMERIAEQASAVIHNSIVFEQTQEDSLTDPLTGLPNRRSMFVHLSRELARAERLRSQVALIVMDMDGFKAINDTYGHHVGDRALREVSFALQDALRPYDLCVRYAGDEFIVVLTDCARETADIKCRELQEAVSRIQLEVRAGKNIPIGMSAGASVFPEDGTTYEALLADADHRMYRDKAARRGEPQVTATLAPEPEFATDVHSRPADDPASTLEHTASMADAFAPEPVA
jgi:diguanylate cyclase (GGDEF)-like protein/putative nucleotidyltransferase with HDIG domain